MQYDISLVCCYLWSKGCCHALQDSRESSVFTTVDKWLRGYYTNPFALVGDPEIYDLK